MSDQDEDETSLNFNSIQDLDSNSSSDDASNSSTGSDNSKTLTKTYGSVTISLIKGEIKSQQVNVIVNSTSSTLDLNKGAASRGLFEAAGDAIQKECREKYPNGISGTEIAITKGGNLNCLHVYHVSLQKWKGDENKKTLEQLVYKCLKKASSGGITSIAVPALGTGLLSYDRDLVARSMFKIVKHFSKIDPDTSLTDVRFVIYPSDTNTYEAFRRRLPNQSPSNEDDDADQSQSESNNLSVAGSTMENPSIGEKLSKLQQRRKLMLEKHLNITSPKLRLVQDMDVTERDVESSTAGKIEVKLSVGVLTKQTCEGVMTTCTRKLDLSNGSLSKSVLDAAGSGLQTECTSKYPQGIQHGEIAVLSPGNMSCKKIYCGALPRFDKPLEGSLTPKQILTKLVMETLKQASSAGLSSICFPTLGTGYLKYPPDVSASLMCTAIKDFAGNNSDSSIKSVIIVIHCTPQTVTNLLQPYKTKLGELLPNTSRPVDPLIATRPNSAKVLSKISKEAMANVLSSRRRVKSARPQRGVISTMRDLVAKSMGVEVSGRSSVSDNQTEEGEKLDISSTEELCVDGATALPARNTPEFCLHMYTEDILPPHYWTVFTNKNSVKTWQVKRKGKPGYELVDVSGPLFKAIVKLVDGTWLQNKIGHGRDALGLENLGFTQIKVMKVQRVENLKLYESYRQKQQKLFHKAGEGPMFKKLSALQAKFGDPKTVEHLDDTLKDTLYEEVNEGLFFHGTKDKNVEGVIREGIDPRLAQGQAVFGKAIYMAESSTKADQYTDERGNERRKDNLKMFLVRCTLGDIYLTKEPKKYCRPPCCVTDCLKDDCSHDKRFDCIVEEERYIFREFVVYEASQAYPEYLITYNRV